MHDLAASMNPRIGAARRYHAHGPPHDPRQGALQLALDCAALLLQLKAGVLGAVVLYQRSNRLAFCRYRSSLRCRWANPVCYSTRVNKTIGAPSPRRCPRCTSRVYPPGRSW